MRCDAHLSTVNVPSSIAVSRRFGTEFSYMAIVGQNHQQQKVDDVIPIPEIKPQPAEFNFRDEK